MPRPALGPRLYLEKRPGRASVWVIRDGENRVRTGCPERARADAEKALGRYLAEKHEPVIDGRATTIPDVLMLYSEHNGAAPVPFHLTALEPFWGDKTLADVTARNCRAYVESRKVKPATARRELETLNAAIRFCAREHGTPVALVTYPDKAAPRTRWLTRGEVARLVWAAWRQGNRHLARFILIGVYTGTRHGAILKLQWRENVNGGWVDLERGVLYRRGTAQKETRKRQPPVRIPPRLLAHLRRWKRHDEGMAHIVHYADKGVAKERRAWVRAREAAGLGRDVVPHCLRHSAVTWRLQRGVSTWDVAGFVGMSEKIVRDVYGHHSPDFQKVAATAF
jgi:integrase